MATLRSYETTTPHLSDYSSSNIYHLFLEGSELILWSIHEILNSETKNSILVRGYESWARTEELSGMRH